MITYDGIVLEHQQTASIEQTNERDPSNSDRLYTKFVFRINAVVTKEEITWKGEPNLGHWDSTTNPDPTSTAKRLEHRLLTPRKRLIYEGPDGTVFLDTEKDDCKGPMPISCTVSNVAEGAWLVAWVCEVCLTTCSAHAPPFLSLKWEMSIDYDSEWRCTRNVSGLLILSSRNVLALDSYRGRITPDVPANFRRETATYTMSPDGLRISFRFVDKELKAAPPLGAVKVTGTQVESVPLPGGIRLGQITIRLTGPLATPPKLLLAAAIRMAMGRALATHPVGANNRVLMGGSITECLDDDRNWVEIQLQWKMSATPHRQKGNNLAREGLRQGRTGLMGAALGGLAGTYFGPLGMVFGAGTGYLAGRLGYLDSLQQNGATNGTSPPASSPDGESVALPIIADWVGAPLQGMRPGGSVEPPLMGLAEHVRLVSAALSDPCGQRVGNIDLRPSIAPNVFSSEAAPGLTVQISTSMADDYLAEYKPSSTPGVYNHYTVNLTYSEDSGISVMPSTGYTHKPNVVRLHNGLTRAELEWSASRSGGPPELPPKQLAYCEYVSGTVTISGIELEADGVTPIYRAAGIYQFAVIDPAYLKMAAPVAPFFNESLLVDAAKALVLIDTRITRNDLAMTNAFTGQGQTLA